MKHINKQEKKGLRENFYFIQQVLMLKEFLLFVPTILNDQCINALLKWYRSVTSSNKQEVIIMSLHQGSLV